MTDRPPQPKLSVEEITNHPVFQQNWYHTIELAPGVFTRGKDHRNICVTRELLKGMDLAGKNCLDIGAQDCLVSLLMKRRGAARVTAQDIQSVETTGKFLESVLGTELEYIQGREAFSQMRKVAVDHGAYPFDIVMFSGVLYHMFDPLTGILTARSVLRNGGLMLIETSGMINDMMAAYFNEKGRYYSGTNFWQVTSQVLDYMLRLAKLAPIDCAYFANPNRVGRKMAVVRMGVVCRAVEENPASPDDEWMRASSIRDGFLMRGFIDWDELKTGKPEVAYTPRNDVTLVQNESTGTIDLTNTLRANPPLTITSVADQVRLKLNAIY